MPLPDIDSIQSYNAAPNGTLVDYSPSEDPTTDQPAAGANAHQASSAMATRTQTRAYCSFTYVSGASAPVTEHDAVWGNSAGVIPVVARISAGKFSVTWPTTVSDALGATHSVNLRRAWGNIVFDATTVYVIYCTRSAANVINVRIVQDGGSGFDPVSVPIDVFAV